MTTPLTPEIEELMRLSENPENRVRWNIRLGPRQSLALLDAARERRERVDPDPVDECEHPWKPYCKDCAPRERVDPDLRARIEEVADEMRYMKGINGFNNVSWEDRLRALLAATEAPRDHAEGKE